MEKQKRVFQRQTEPKAGESKCQTSVRTLLTRRWKTLGRFLLDGVSMAREQMRLFLGRVVCSDCVSVSVLRVSEWDYSTGRVGGPLVCCEIKLKDWVEGECGLSFTLPKMSLHGKRTHEFRQSITSRIQWLRCAYKKSGPFILKCVSVSHFSFMYQVCVHFFSVTQKQVVADTNCFSELHKGRPPKPGIKLSTIWL